MGKKTSGKHYVSKGDRRSVAKSTTKAVKAARSDLDREMYRLEAYRKGKNPKGYEELGDPRFNKFSMK